MGISFERNLEDLVQLLHPPIDFKNYCCKCQTVTQHTACLQVDAGVIGNCDRCGEQILRRWSRTNSNLVHPLLKEAEATKRRSPSWYTPTPPDSPASKSDAS